MSVPWFDLSVREQLDAETLVFDMLSADTYPEGLQAPVVVSELDLGTGGDVVGRDVIVFSCGAPYQPETNLKAWTWRFPLTLTVLSADAERGAWLARVVHANVGAWPWSQPSSAGRVGRIVSNPGFARVLGDGATNSKMVSRWVSEKVIEAGSPKGS